MTIARKILLNLALFVLRRIWDIVDKNDDNALSETEIREAYNGAMTRLQKLKDNFIK